jgi:hypothetical protein
MRREGYTTFVTLHCPSHLLTGRAPAFDSTSEHVHDIMIVSSNFTAFRTISPVPAMTRNTPKPQLHRSSSWSSFSCSDDSFLSDDSVPNRTPTDNDCSPIPTMTELPTSKEPDAIDKGTPLPPMASQPPNPKPVHGIKRCIIQAIAFVGSWYISHTVTQKLVTVRLAPPCAPCPPPVIHVLPCSTTTTVTAYHATLQMSVPADPAGMGGWERKVWVRMSFENYGKLHALMNADASASEWKEGLDE